MGVNFKEYLRYQVDFNGVLPRIDEARQWDR
jgi:hypothetical protein